MNTMSEKRGYKYTEELGFIPDDWEIKSLGERGTFSKGVGISKEDICDEGCKCIRYAEIYTKYNYKVANFYSHINETTAKIAKLSKKNDLFFAGSGETKEEIGKCVACLQDEVYVGGDTIIYSNNTDNTLYMSYFLNTIGRQQLNKLGQGDAIVHIHSDNLKKVLIPFPPLLEQEKIAEVLSDVDSLIDKTQQLIDKKKNLKIATMQKLLTPKEGWQEKCFEQLFSKIPSKNYQIKTTEYRQYGKFPVVDQGQIKICGYSDNINKVYKNQNGVIVFGDHTRIFKYIDFDFVIGADGTQILNVNNENDVKYIYYMLCQKEIPNIGYNRHFKFLLDFKYCLPSKSEQQKIASILSDMDFEIESLEKEMEKYIDLKIGMMQQLLTGKVRLV